MIIKTLLICIVISIASLGCTSSGNLYFTSGNSVRVITSGGFVKTVAGNYSNVGYNNGTSE